MKKKYVVKLKSKEKKTLKSIVNKGKNLARVIKRAKAG